MSKITLSSVWAPPIFPLAGRLPDNVTSTHENVDLQVREEKEFHLQLNAKTGVHHPPPCCKSLHVSLFFDGTNNNEKHSTANSPPNPSNIARMFHASLLEEYEGYYRYYMPGVGTAFPEIGELNFTEEGLQNATGGEARINWALLRIVDALSHTLTGKGLKDEDAEALVHKMSSLKGEPSTMAKWRRQRILRELLEPLRARAKRHKPTILKVKLFVYGFSRGAAEARTFINWLTEILDAALLKTPTSRPEILGYPMSIEFLGLCDTVASVGIPHLIPGFDGHMSWADDSLALPDEGKFPGFIQHCYHFVSAHEQRLCFPLDSVRRTLGNYPTGTIEVIYPGVHSDVGGGYPTGDQGKSLIDRELLSQIVLHDLYGAAFAVGAPLRVPEGTVPNYLQSTKPDRVMAVNVYDEFRVDPTLIQRFNAWRTTLGLDVEEPTDKPYTPVLLDQPLEQTVEHQMAWMTAWRIGRLANGSYARQPFFIEARHNSRDEDPVVEQQSKKDHQALQAAAEKKRKNGVPRAPGVPIFEPVKDQLQLTEGANEFGADYESTPLTVGLSRSKGLHQVLLDDVAGAIMYICNSDDVAAEYAHMKAAGQKLHDQLFQNPYGKVSDHPVGAHVCALYDNQIHDSRAWFMHSTLGSREAWAGYFRYRMIFSGDHANKQMSLLQMPREHAKLKLGLAIYSVGALVDGVAAMPSTLGSAGKFAAEKARQAASEALDAATEAVKRAAIEKIKGTVEKLVPGRPSFSAYNGPVPALQCEVSNFQGQMLYPQPVLTQVCAPTTEFGELRVQSRQLELARYEQQQESLLAELNARPSSGTVV